MCPTLGLYSCLLWQRDSENASVSSPFCSCVLAKRVSLSQAFLAEIVETGDKNRDVPHRYTLFCAERLGKIDEKDVELFSLERVGPRKC